MDKLFQLTLMNMESTLRVIEERVPAPKIIEFGDAHAFRYVERTIHQAIIQKLARIISGLHAARLLLSHGFVQELGALQRMLDEFQEDVAFLSYGVICNDITDLHTKYLEAFYQEEFDRPDDPLASAQNRPMIPRKKIRSYLSEVDGSDPSRGVKLLRTISKAYSGFVHGASPHIMDMYGGNPPRFHVSGMLGTPRLDEHADDLRNYFYRGIIAFAFAAKAFGNESLFSSIREFLNRFETLSGKRFLD